jgi:hypothetical protein
MQTFAPSPAAMRVDTTKAGAVNWERVWRQNGITFVLFFVAGYLFFGAPPKIGAPADALAAFYDGNQIRIFIAVFLFGNALLNLLWFTATITSTLREAGQGGWATAATASSAVVGGAFLMLLTVSMGLAYSIAGYGNSALTSGLNDLLWLGIVMSSFPRAMLVMAGSFGLWRAGLISNTLFAAGVAAVVLVLLGGTTWIGNGIWAPDGAYSRLICPIINLAWFAAAGVVMSRIPATRGEW